MARSQLQMSDFTSISPYLSLLGGMVTQAVSDLNINVTAMRGTRQCREEFSALIDAARFFLDGRIDVYEDLIGAPGIFGGIVKANQPKAIEILKNYENIKKASDVVLHQQERKAKIRRILNKSLKKLQAVSEVTI